MDSPEYMTIDSAPAPASTTPDSDAVPAPTNNTIPGSDTADAVERQSSVHFEDMPAQNPSGSEIRSNPFASPANSEVPVSVSLVMPANPSRQQRADIAWPELQPSAKVPKPGSGLSLGKKRQASSYRHVTSEDSCPCFADESYCAQFCSCQGCFNLRRPDYEDSIADAHEEVQSQNPLAFQSTRTRLLNGGGGGGRR
ncbi:CRC domain-containing protein [Abeliophyllum distichum]|uniref:CRC domain-containing protein n=1 Tax=Abeliophyllum distichum TaxID=126358 RepID=A0ABD1W269_9LAMI